LRGFALVAAEGFFAVLFENFATGEVVACFFGVALLDGAVGFNQG